MLLPPRLIRVLADSASGVRCHLLLMLALTLLVLAPSVQAEKYLSMEEAQKLCFPEATTFEHQVIRFSRDQYNALTERLGGKPLNRGNQVWLALKDGQLLGLVVFDQVPGKYELIDYVVALKPDGTIGAVEITEYRESHGVEIRSEKWRKQFREKKPADPVRLNNDIYNISGATISCRAVTDGVRRVLATYDLVFRPRLVADGRLPESQPDSDAR